LLALCRYWNVIEYYFPYKYLIGQKWTNILTEFTPKFVHTKNKREYYLELLELVSAIHDSHAQLISKEIDYLKGLYTLPFQVKFIQGKLVVTNYYLDDKALKNSILPGDIIQNIDDTPVTDLLTRYLPFTSGSNIDAQLRDLTSARGFLPRSNSILANLTIVRNGKTLQVNINRSPIGKINSSIDYSDNYDMPSDTVLAGSIGYINPSKLKEDAFDQLRAKMQKTKGLIIDLRCYPTIFMPFIYGSWLKQSPSAFAVTTISNPQAPGSFIATSAICNGGNSSSYPPIQEHCQGKLVVLVSTHTQGAAEYSTMSLSSTPNALVVGSTTAGADGNISRIGLPGFLTTTFSGIGIYYPEFQETQRVGIKIDVPITPTIEAVKAHRDEYLERALKIINQ
jgi:C-terminal processing protease CtpA/Prc